MTNNQELDIHVENEITRIQKERKENRLLLTEQKIEQQTFNKRDAALIRELEELFIQRNVSKILF